MGSVHPDHYHHHHYRLKKTKTATTMMPFRSIWCSYTLLLLALVPFQHATATVSLPYNPTRILIPSDSDASSLAYVFRPQSNGNSQFELATLNFSSTVDASDVQFTAVSTSLPFLDSAADGDDDAFIPVLNEDGTIAVYAGTCDDGSDGATIWTFQQGSSWVQSDMASTGNNDQMGANFLASGLSFSATTGTNDSLLYIFGGMCPSSNDSSSVDWISNATYSNIMTCLSPTDSSSKVTYSVSAVSERGPPVAEAGFTITPLTPTVSNSSGETQSRQQNFLFTGGHTETAFINMSQLAVYSLPEESWTFVTVQEQSGDVKTDLTLAIRDDTEIEPRSGHSAVLTSDGSKIIVLGGWVGDVSTAASPQLVVLELAEGYGGDGAWTWTIPDQTDSPWTSDSGIFGHGAAMLPGDMMIVTGGYEIGSSSSKRSTGLSPSQKTYLFNTSSGSWVNTYSAPITSTGTSSSDNSSGGLLSKTGQKVGLGTGLVIGAASVVGLALFYMWHRRRKQQQRRLREQELRDMAFGVEQLYPGGSDGPYRPASADLSTSSFYSGHKRKRSDTQGDQYPWAPVYNGAVGEGPGWRQNGGSEAERTGLLFDVPSPTRGLRRASHAKPWVYQPAPKFDDGRRIDPIDERDEYEARDSANENENENERDGREGSPEMQQISDRDPFRDPPRLVTASGHRNPLRLSPVTKDDLTAAGLAEDLDNGGWHGRGIRSVSPEKSDRTSSDLSEHSARSGLSAVSAGSNSIQQSHSGGIVSRSISQRSSDLLGSARGGPTPDSMTSSHFSHSHKRTLSLPLSSSPGPSLPSEWDRSNTADTFSTAHTSWPQLQAEGEMLLSGGVGSGEPNWYTPPDSPTKMGPRSRKIGWIGSVRRALTGRGGDDNDKSSPAASRAANDLKYSSPMMMDRDYYYYTGSGLTGTSYNDDFYQSSSTSSTTVPRRAVSASAALLKRKQGAKDWDVDPGGGGGGSNNKNNSNMMRRRRSTRSHTLSIPGQLQPDTFLPDPGDLIFDEADEDNEAEQTQQKRNNPNAPAYYHDHINDHENATDDNNNNDDDYGDHHGFDEEEEEEDEDDDDGEWDVETAVQRRSVQVMFTVPKERLRVVNVDADDIGSRKSIDSSRVASASASASASGI